MLVPSHSLGTPFSRLIPSPDGPRHAGQFSLVQTDGTNTLTSNSILRNIAAQYHWRLGGNQEGSSFEVYVLQFGFLYLLSPALPPLRSPLLVV